MSLDGRDEVQVSETEVVEPAVSPDGKLAAYFFRANAEEPYRLALMSTDNGKVLKTLNLTEDKPMPVCIAWESDNRNLFYITLRSSHSLWRQSVDNDRPHLIADLGNEEINDFAISPDGNYIGLIRGKWVLGAVLIEGLR